MVSFEISELIATFRESILTLMPVADRALLSWRDEDAHDDWERLVESAFHVFVQSPISLDPAHRTALPLARYDFNIPTYKHSSWIEVVSADRPSGLALVRFEAGAGDFRTMWLADPRAAGYPSPQGESREWSPDVKFRFARRDRRAGISLHDAVTPIE
ncbi:hypothetical protein [Herbiconiux sp.]|uniref:hypothetical protein n=1 Tax=Herbiconiux sp. TaxID=1871186 RepID=UPI0025C65538|nr:hypothetical protein [Herbiconiux sp.]